MTPPRTDLPHIFISGTGKPERYTAHGSGSGRDPRLVPNRAGHGRRIRKQLEQAWDDALARRPRTARPFGGVDGAYLEFLSPPGVALALNSLEATRSGIELVAAHEVTGVEHATVFVPADKEGHFLQIVDAFLTKTTKSGKRPKNESLLATIAQVRAATLESFWTDDPSLFPAANAVTRWEVWLRVEPKTAPAETLERFRLYARAQGVAVSPGHLTFLDRLVVEAVARPEQLSASIDLLSSIAELRLSKESAEFFTRMDRIEQDEWVRDLLARTQLAPPDAPVVCVLDTGVTRGHPLLDPSLASVDQHAYDAAWGVHDHHGHGTEMAGLALYGDLATAFASAGPVELTHGLESSKILPPRGENRPDLYGVITAGSLALAEIQAPHRRRVACMMTTSTEFRDRGQPTSWSAEIDALCAGVDDMAVRRLFVISAGNSRTADAREYPAGNESDGIHDPGQAWNALTVGAYTEKVRITEPAL